MDDGEKKQLPMPVIAAVAVLAVGLAGFVGWKQFGPKPPPAMTTQESQNSDVIAQMVKRTNGDMSKLTPEDRQKLYTMAGGFWTKAYENKKKDLGM